MLLRATSVRRAVNPQVECPLEHKKIILYQEDVLVEYGSSSSRRLFLPYRRPEVNDETANEWVSNSHPGFKIALNR